jgi:regulator of RNase E activity RraA
MTVPAIWVVKTVGKRPDHECVLGDGMAKALYSVGCVATITDGGVRDIEGLLTVPFAAYCKGKTIHHCALRLKATDRPTSIGGITVSSGDILHANSEGVIKLPQRSLSELIPSAIRMRAFENEAHTLMRQTEVEPAAKEAAIGKLLGKDGLLPGITKDSRLSAIQAHPRRSTRFQGKR